MQNDNGTVTYELCAGRQKYTVKTTRGKITAKRVETATRVWDHAGKRVSAYRGGMMSIRLLAFQIDGGALVRVALPTSCKDAQAVAPNELVSG